MCPNTAVTRPSRARRLETHGTRKTENSPLGGGAGRGAPGTPPRTKCVQLRWCWVRPYLAECNISRPICEVKRPRASLVRRSVMALEPGVPYPPQLFFCQHLGVGASALG
ncbi:uncharacterized protein TM35_000054720 [Trypanosoma theileri]|uniref:Uncharacterized protein n=1 Tax=Trypanosoma theileri TaxID=67003 RepID=A0A1X0P4L3_9TRYP|nr:uncharacterized protein TM35_000054720 [Trypanosoma theileri]ORC91876.1 hypothetical protein TM35_000054720 [Trypanosoma theileri]